MQNISIDQEKINYEKRWYPNFEGLIQIADHYQLDFVNNYSELANGLFSVPSYQNGVLMMSGSARRISRPIDTIRRSAYLFMMIKTIPLNG
jgi:hypothetical protein